MSWISRILRRGRRAPVEQIVGIIERIAERVQTLAEYREAVAKAAEVGDLDGAFNTVRAANRRAQDFIDNG